MSDQATAEAEEPSLLEGLARTVACQALKDAGVDERVQDPPECDFRLEAPAHAVCEFGCENVDRNFEAPSGAKTFAVNDIDYGSNEGASGSAGVVLFEYDSVHAVVVWRAYWPDYSDDNYDARVSGQVHVTLPAEAAKVFARARERLLADHAGSVVRVLSMTIAGATGSEVGTAINKALTDAQVDPGGRQYRLEVMRALLGSEQGASA